MRFLKNCFIAGTISILLASSVNAGSVLDALRKTRCLLSSVKERIFGTQTRAEYVALEPDLGFQAALESGAAVDLTLRNPTYRDWRKLMEGPKGKSETLGFVEDSRGHIRVLDQPIDFTKDAPFLIRDQDGNVSILRKAGTLSFDRKAKKFLFTDDLQTSAEEHEALKKELQEILPKKSTVKEIENRKEPILDREKVLKCASFATKNGHGFTFLATKIGVDATIQSFTMWQSGRFKEHDGRTSDKGVRSWQTGMGWVVLHDIGSAGLDILLIRSGASYAKAFLVKFGDGVTETILGRDYNHLAMGKYDTQNHFEWFPTGQIKRFGPYLWRRVFQGYGTGPGEADQTGAMTLSEKMSDAGFVYGMMRLMPGYVIDKGFLNNLPTFVMKMCQINPAFGLIINNGTIRMVDRSSNAYLSVKLTNWYVGNENFKDKPAQSKEKQELKAPR